MPAVSMHSPDNVTTYEQDEYVPFVLVVADCSVEYSISLYRVSNTFARAQASESPATQPVTPDATITLTPECRVGDSGEGIITYWWLADVEPGDYIVEISYPTNNVSYGGTFTVTG
jgi:hypothetical protein